jgi:hypothetical protein
VSLLAWCHEWPLAHSIGSPAAVWAWLPVVSGQGGKGPAKGALLGQARNHDGVQLQSAWKFVLSATAALQALGSHPQTPVRRSMQKSIPGAWGT